MASTDVSWWAALKGRLASIARRILDALLGRIEADYREWNSEYTRFIQEIQSAKQRFADLESRAAALPEATRMAHVRTFAAEVRALSDSVYAANRQVARIIEAMGQSIVDAAVQRKLIETQWRAARGRTKNELQQQIDSLHLLRDQHLVPRQREVQSQRSILLDELRSLNKKVEELTGTRPGVGGPVGTRADLTSPAPIPCTVKFYSSEKAFGFVTTPSGDAHLSASRLPPGRVPVSGDVLMCVIRTTNRGLQVSQVV